MMVAESRTTDDTDINFLVRGVCSVCYRRIYKDEDFHKVGDDEVFICQYCWCAEEEKK